MVRRTARWGVFILIAALTAAAGALAPDREVEEIQNVLKAQEAAWNAKDIQGFMAFYWHSDDLTFQSGAERYRGWQTMLERYQKNYADENWGKLSFSDLEIKTLGPEAAYVLGRWKVEASSKRSQGVFSLILRKFPEGWRIVHDHTS